MPDYTPMQGFPYPIESDDPDIPGDMQALATSVERRVMGVYADASDRDTKIPSPQTGQFAYLAGSNQVTVYTGAGWIDYPEANLQQTHYGTSAPSSGLGNDGDVYFRV